MIIITYCHILDPAFPKKDSINIQYNLHKNGVNKKSYCM